MTTGRVTFTGTTAGLVTTGRVTTGWVTAGRVTTGVDRLGIIPGLSENSISTILSPRSNSALAICIFCKKSPTILITKKSRGWWLIKFTVRELMDFLE
jgi:hypothetical protein